MRRYITLLAIGILALTSVGCGSRSTRKYDTVVKVEAAKPPDYGPIGEAGKVLCFTLIAIAVIAAITILARGSNSKKRHRPKQQLPRDYRGRKSRRHRYHRRRYPPRYRRKVRRRHQPHSKGKLRRTRQTIRARRNSRKKQQPNQPATK